MIQLPTRSRIVYKPKLTEFGSVRLTRFEVYVKALDLCEREALQVIERRMRVAKTFTTAFLAIILLVTLDRGTGQNSCKQVFEFVPVTMPKNNSDVTCVGWRVHGKCAGTCTSSSIFAMKEGGAHWYQDCKCCQPVGGRATLSANWNLNCTDNSTMSIHFPIIYPSGCQCTKC